jgi:hypothetical protein
VAEGLGGASVNPEVGSRWRGQLPAPAENRLGANYQVFGRNYQAGVPDSAPLHRYETETLLEEISEINHQAGAQYEVRLATRWLIFE